MNRNICLLLLLVSLIVALAACASLEVSPGPSPTSPITAAEARETSSPRPTLTATNVSPTPDREMTPSFGDPIAIGRGGIRDAAFSPDRETIAIGWANGVSLTRVDDQVDLWYRETPQMIIALDVSDTHVAAVLVTGDVWLFDEANGASRVFEEASLADAYWGDVAWSPDGGLAAIQTIGGAGAGATPVLILDPAANQIRQLPGSLTDSGWQPYLRWSPDSRMIASADRDGRAWVLDATTGEVVFRVEADRADFRPRIYAWMPDSSIVVYSASGPAGLSLADVLTGEVVLELNETSAGDVPSPPVFFAPHSALALVGGYGPGAYEIFPYEVWDLAAGVPLGAPPVGEQRHVSSAGCMWLERPAVAFDGQEVLYLDTDGQLVRWPVDAAEGELLGQLPIRHPCLNTPTVWSPDGARLVLETDPGRAVTVWQAATGQLIAERTDGTYPADIHGSLLAYRGVDEQLILWDLESQTVRSILPGPVTAFTGGDAFSPDGRLLAYGAGNALNITDVGTGEVVARLDAYPEDQQVSHIRWAPGSDALAAAGGLIGGTTELPGTTILWERQGTSFREVLRTQTVHANYDVDWANPALFNPSGNRVALERMPALEAGRQAVLVYDRLRGEVIMVRQDFVIRQWLSDEVLLVAEAAGWMNFYTWHVLTGVQEYAGRGGWEPVVGSYAPDGIHHAGIFFDPPPPRSIVIRDWRSGEKVATAYLGVDVQDVRFSPDGRRVAARGGPGLVKVWPVIYR